MSNKKKRGKPIQDTPAHVHSVLILPGNRFSLIDREPPSIGTIHLCQDENPLDSSFFPRELRCIFDVLKYGNNHSFLIQQGSTKTSGRLSALPEKHPELSAILNTLFGHLNSLPIGKRWYAEYQRLAREQASANSRRRTALPTTH